MATVVNAGESVEDAWAKTPSGTLILKAGVHTFKDTTPYLSNNGKGAITVQFEDGAVFDGRDKALKFMEVRTSGFRLANATVRNLLEDGVFWGSGGLTGCELVDCLIERVGQGNGKNAWGSWSIKQHWGSYLSAGGTAGDPIRHLRCIFQDCRHGGFQTYSGVVHAVFRDCIIRRIGGRAQVAWAPFPAVYPPDHSNAGQATNDYAVGWMNYSGLGSLLLDNCLVHDVAKVGAAAQLAPWAYVRQGAMVRNVRWWNAAAKTEGGGTFENVVQGEGGFLVTPSGAPGPGTTPPPDPEPEPEPEPEPPPVDPSLAKLGTDVRAYHNSLSQSNKNSVGGRLADVIADSLGK